MSNWFLDRISNDSTYSSYVNFSFSYSGWHNNFSGCGFHYKQIVYLLSYPDDMSFTATMLKVSC